MSPNLFLLARKACSPHHWFDSKKPSRPLDFMEIWSSPVPGVYRHRPTSGWSLVAVQDSSEFFELETPLKVVYAKSLHRYLFQEDFLDRKRRGFRQDQPSQKDAQTFFRMDDGYTWVQCYNSEDEFIPGPYQRFILDERTAQFRPMLKKDDIDAHSPRNGSASSSVASSLHCTTGDNSEAITRKNSFERQCGSVRCTPAGSIRDEKRARDSSRSSFEPS